MGGTEINVAYNGTSADLGVSDVALYNSTFSWDDLCASTDDFPLGASFTAINENNGTVSPKDLFNDSSLGSVPPSAAYTNLTTPSSTLLESPDSAYETSPLYDTLSAKAPLHDEWFSLFPIDSNDRPSPPAMSRTISSGSQIVVHPGGDFEKRSSTSASPLTASVRHSSVAGVRKREKVLPPIVVDEEDTVALKRARNTAAARKSRDKKVRERNTLEDRIAELEGEVQRWKALALAKHPQLNAG